MTKKEYIQQLRQKEAESLILEENLKLKNEIEELKKKIENSNNG